MPSDNIHKGHRQKMKQRFLQNGLAGEPSHNVLELLLFFGIPYKDTNPIAHELIERFGSLSGVLRASPAELRQVKGMTDNAATLLHLILPVYEKYAEDLLEERPVLETTEDIVRFMRPKFICGTNEVVYLLCFGAQGKLLSLRKISEGDIRNAPLDMRALAAVALETKAQDVVLMHNHPNGIALPSSEDVETTKLAFQFLRDLKVNLRNHIIISEDGFCSMADMKQFVHIFYGLNPLF